jgi:MFS family permease
MLGVLKNPRDSLFSAWLIIAVSAAFYSYDVLLRIAPGVMKQDLMLHYDISAAKLSGITSVYFLVYAPMQMPVGMLLDRYGPKFLLSLSGVICAVGIALFAATSLVSVAAMSRFMIGLGSAFAFVGVLKLASIMLPPSRFAFVSGLTMASGKFGATIGDHLIANLLLVESWQRICIQAAFLGGILTLLMLYLIPHDVHHKQQDSEGSSFRDIWGIVKKLSTNPQLWIIALIGCLSYTPLTLYAEHFGIEFLQVKYGISHIRASSINSCLFLGWMLGGPIVCTFSDYIKSRRIPVILGLVSSLICCILVLYFPIPISMLPALMIVFGMTNSVQVIAFPMAREVGGTRYTATAIALTNMICMLSGLMQGVIGWLYDYTHLVMQKSVSADMLSLVSYRVAYLPLPVFLGCAIILAVIMRETYGQDAQET